MKIGSKKLYLYACLFGFLTSAVLCTWILHAHYIGARDTFDTLRTFAFLVLLLIIVSILISIRPIRRVAIVMTIILSIHCVATVGSMFFIGPVHKAGITKLVEHAAPLIEAIHKFTKDHGRPPDGLESIIPDYLPRLPETGMFSSPVYEYSFIAPDIPANLYWYDLGTCRGKLLDEERKYNVGEPDQAILVFEIARDGTILNMCIDRLPDVITEVDFNALEWDSDLSKRAGMVESMSEILKPVGRPIEEIMVVLGDPDGLRMLRNTPWEIRVSYKAELHGWGILLYWPTEDYPEEIYDGSVMRIGNWAYVHDVFSCWDVSSTR